MKQKRLFVGQNLLHEDREATVRKYWQLVEMEVTVGQNWWYDKRKATILVFFVNYECRIKGGKTRPRAPAHALLDLVAMQ